MSRYPLNPLDFSRLRTTSLAGRPAKVRVEDFARPYHGGGVRALVEGLPRLLAGNQFRALATAVLEARSKGLPVLWGLGGHVIKCGLAPVLLDLMEHGFLTAFALNGAAAIHDLEIALAGATSEEVGEVLTDGRFGAAEETAATFHRAAGQAAKDSLGLGESLGQVLQGAPFGQASLLVQAYQRAVPVTVHVALGTDTPHNDPRMDPAALGQASYRDFRLFAELVRQLEGGGVYLNVGSAVVLPEVFLKAVSVVRNLGHRLQDFHAANLDFIQHYRPTRNVVERPTAQGGHGYALTGHHEILLPLLAAYLVESLS